MTVSNGFAHGDDVRDNVLQFESPPMTPHTTKADLHFIGNTHTRPQREP